MNIDVVPDITMRGQDDPHGRSIGPRPPTVGQLATRLRDLAGRSGDWWALIRFDPARPSRTPLDPAAAYAYAYADTDTDTDTDAAGAGAGPAVAADLWLTTWPPGHRAGLAGLADDHRPEVSTLIAGELIEATIGPDGVTERPLRAGRMRVRGATPHRPGADARELHNPGSTYAITLHVRPR